jgi:hypothetical protein
MRVRHLLVGMLLIAIPLQGCASVIPGYSFFGTPMSQSARDDDRSPQYFFWSEAPEPPHEHWNPGALLVNLVTTVAVDAAVVATVIGIAFMIGALTGDHDDDHEEHEKHHHHKKHEHDEHRNPAHERGRWRRHLEKR